LRAFRAVFMARYRQFVRDRGALVLSFIFPIIFILIFGWAFQNSDTQTFKVGLVDDGSPQTASLISQGLDSVIIQNNQKVFEVQNGAMDELLSSLKNGDLDAVMVVPQGIDSSLSQGQTANIQVYYDPSLISNQQTLIPTLNQVINTINQHIEGIAPPISIEGKNIQSHQLRYIDFLVPGILGMAFMFIGVQQCMPIIQQRQAHIIKRLGSTPLRRSMLVFGDVVFRIIIVFISAALIILVGRSVFNVQMLGNWLSLFGIIILGGLIFVSIGYLIAAFVKTQESAVPVVQIIIFPMMFLSGTFFSVGSMPSVIEPFVKILPLTYLNDALRQIMVAGTPVHSMTTDIAAMVGWVVVCLGISIRFFQWD
jgi:ABC-2 type transport system permease protein